MLKIPEVLARRLRALEAPHSPEECWGLSVIRSGHEAEDWAVLEEKYGPCPEGVYPIISSIPTLPVPEETE